MKSNKTVFRYPGGKAKLAQQIVSMIKSQIGFDQWNDNDMSDFVFVDVFVGGGSVFASAIDGIGFTKSHINDLDDWMYSFWNVVASNSLSSLKDKINKTPINIDTFNARRELKDLSDVEKAFSALFFNRTTFSGMLESGPIGGYSQEGKYKIDCRWNKNSILSKLDFLSSCCKKSNVNVTKLDFRDVIKMHMMNPKAIMYLDPPYMTQGSQLYRHWMVEQDYEEMRDLLKSAQCKWVLSHDDNPKFVKMYDGWSDIDNIDGVPYTINSIKGKKRTELLIVPKRN